MKRDPNKTARNKAIQEYKEQLRVLLPSVLSATGFPSEANLNAFIGGKTGCLIDLVNERISSSDHYVSLWLSGLEEKVQDHDTSQQFLALYNQLQSIYSFNTYVGIFLRRSYLKYSEELSRIRPNERESSYWFGLNDQDYGLFITPRLNGDTWENDKSEERSFPAEYWTLGHVLISGFVVPDTKDRIQFSDLNEFIKFYKHVLVRSTRSNYQIKIAELYCSYIEQSDSPNNVLFLFPELRYGGKDIKHKYRLDFSLINNQLQEKIGFELSPWSTHGYISKTKELSQKEINIQAADNFQSEIDKINNYYLQHGITTLTFSDRDLKNIERIFEDNIVPRLNIQQNRPIINYELLRHFNFFGSKNE